MQVSPQFYVKFQPIETLYGKAVAGRMPFARDVYGHRISLSSDNAANGSGRQYFESKNSCRGCRILVQWVSFLVFQTLREMDRILWTFDPGSFWLEPYAVASQHVALTTFPQRTTRTRFAWACSARTGSYDAQRETHVRTR